MKWVFEHQDLQIFSPKLNKHDCIFTHSSCGLQLRDNFEVVENLNKIT